MTADSGGSAGLGNGSRRLASSHRTTSWGEGATVGREMRRYQAG